MACGDKSNAGIKLLWRTDAHQHLKDCVWWPIYVFAEILLLLLLVVFIIVTLLLSLWFFKEGFSGMLSIAPF